MNSAASAVRMSIMRWPSARGSMPMLPTQENRGSLTPPLYRVSSTPLREQLAQELLAGDCVPAAALWDRVLPHVLLHRAAASLSSVNVREDAHATAATHTLWVLSTIEQGSIRCSQQVSGLPNDAQVVWRTVSQ